MRFSQDTRYPHPVLTPTTGDYLAGEFDMSFRYQEDPSTGALSVFHEIQLTEAGIRSLVEGNKASVGCFVRCDDTYHTELRSLAWSSGRSDFAAGALLNRVILTPLVWLKDSVSSWNPGSIHSEFAPPLNLEKGDILAIGEEHIIQVGQAKLTPIESIFELNQSSDVPEGTIRVETEGDKITILVGPETHQTIMVMRGRTDGKPVVMNSIFLPAVMEVLDILKQDSVAQYAGCRWYTPFTARCDARGVDIAASTSLLEDAQKLLDNPLQSLSILEREVD